MSNSKKNKRGARGSTEEELTVSKRPNMETDNERTEEEVEETDATEPNLSDIRALLLSIQKTTNDILKENNKLSNEVGKLKSSLKRLESELLATKSTLNTVQNTNKELRVELDAVKRKISQQRDEFDELQEGLDELEQYSRKNSLEIVSVPDSIRDNEGAVLKIAKALNVQVKDMPSFFDELKTLYNYDLGQMVLFNNREILINGKPFFIKEWFTKGIIAISNLLDEQGQPLSYQAFKMKYRCKTNFLNYYQVTSAIPVSLLARSRNNYLQSFPKNIFLENPSTIEFNNSTKLNLMKLPK